MTGYDLKTRAFDRTVVHFWGAVQQQIYRELDKMAELRWVEFELEYQPDKPPRKVYHITAAGRDELARWLRLAQPLVQHREPFLIQLFFAAQLSNVEIITVLEGQREGHQRRLDSLRAIVIPPTDQPTVQRQQMLASLTLDLGVRLEQMYLDWLADAIAAVRGLPG